MADTSGEADIRGIDVDKLAKGFADEENVFKKFCVQTSTSAREIRWYQKTSGFLDVPDTTNTTLSRISGVAEGALPDVAEQSWTRQTSYVKKYFVESPTLSDEDIKDSDIDILATNVRDLTRAVQRKVDLRIYSVLVEATAAAPTVPHTVLGLSGSATADGWDDATTGNPIADINTAEQQIRSYGYDAKGAILVMNSLEHMYLKNYLINVKGSSIPALSSELAKSGVVMSILGHGIVVTENWVTDTVGMFIPGRTVTWKSFVPITAVTMKDPGIGTKIRVWEEGEAIMTDPKSFYLIYDTAV